MPALLDTHAWQWWVTEDPRLSRVAGARIAKAQREDRGIRDYPHVRSVW